MATLVRNRLQPKGREGAAFDLYTMPNPQQRPALDLVGAIAV